VNRHLWLLVLTMGLAGAAPPLHAENTTWFGFQVGVSGGNAPPPVVFRSEPHVIVVSNVEVVETWWRLRGGYWYRSASWRGPWVSIDVRRVPERVLVVPAEHWKHRPRHGGEYAVAGREEGRGRARHRGHDDDRDSKDRGND
jgi:hypothetical protein